ncbi:hypothetical protein HA402_000481 [Bradysia odoriphaga]|nr:hypothetical protein HA402_000481 [Bradysia odoriphaga]
MNYSFFEMYNPTGHPTEEDEEQTNELVQKVAGKAKSTHDVLDDPKLSKETGTFVKVEKDDDEPFETNESEDPEEVMAKIRNKLKSSQFSDKRNERAPEKNESKVEEIVPVSDSDSDEFGNELERERKIKRKKKADEIREQIVSLKKEYSKDKRAKNQLLEKR